jgi:hypothetical protein
VCRPDPARRSSGARHDQGPGLDDRLGPLGPGTALGRETNGRWGQAIEVPGLGTLNKGGDVEHVSVSCGSAGDCVAAGSYADRNGTGRGFVVSETNGRWGQAIEVPGLAVLNKGGDVEHVSVSCSPARTCAAGGLYFDRNDNSQGFVTSQT